MRRYYIKNLKTNKVLMRISGGWVKNNYVEKLIWMDESKIKDFTMFTVERLNQNIKDLIYKNKQEEINDCEIISLEVKFNPIKTNMKLKSYKDKYEQKRIVEKLRWST